MAAIILGDIEDNCEFRHILSEIYEREDVKEGITSGCGYELPSGWYMEGQYHHCLFIETSSNTILGTMFYELLDADTTARTHVNILPEWQQRNITTACGNLYMRHMPAKYPSMQKLEGIIPDTNKVAQRYAIRMGWEKTGTLYAPIPGNVSLFEYSLIGDSNE